ncbi:MAG: hypothetical protein KF687_09540 [Cyclobacteriaceae bacterium]|nr:hypothetical protein [Cyclobacteriaceae bacterium]
MKFILIGVFASFVSFSFAQVKTPHGKSRTKKVIYEEIDLEEMIKRYFGKNSGAASSLEGIYSVSAVITKTNRPFLASQDRTKVIDRKDNYARVAILKDWPGSKRDFIEVSMSYHVSNKYPVVGDFAYLTDDRGYTYRHIEPDGTKITFTMLYNLSDLMEGSYTFMHKRKIISYKLSYLKIYPKANEEIVRN